ncbi:MAG: hypothetical protein AB1390_07270 [Nitrospirota bacterium]
MLAGYNTNISYKNEIFHVQTEDNGQNNPVVITLLYHKGAILASKKTNYAPLLGEPGHKIKIRNIMRDQHKTMIKELLSGKYKTAYLQETPEKEEEAEKPRERHEETVSLDDVLLNYIMKRAKRG